MRELRTAMIVVGLYMLVVILLVNMTGCSLPQKIVKIPQAVLLPEDMIYTLPVGQMINVEFDGEPIEMTFPSPMKVVNSSFLVRQEVIKNDELYKEIKAEKEKGTRNAIFSAILSILATVGGVFLKAKFSAKKKTKISATIE